MKLHTCFIVIKQKPLESINLHKTYRITHESKHTDNRPRQKPDKTEKQRTVSVAKLPNWNIIMCKHLTKIDINLLTNLVVFCTNIKFNFIRIIFT